MKKTEAFLILVTLINLGLFGVRFLKLNKTEPEHYSQKTTTLEEADKKENLFFNAMIDENKVIQKGIELPKEPILILRFSYRNCNICINSALSEFQRFSDSIQSNRTKVIGSFMSNRDLQLFLGSEKKFTFNITNEADDFLGLDLEKNASTPFFLVLFPDGSARHVFVPIMNDTLRTRRYLNIIHQKYYAK